VAFTTPKNKPTRTGLGDFLPVPRRSSTPPKRPYTRLTEPSRPPDVRDISARIKQGTKPLGLGVEAGATAPALATPQTQSGGSPAQTQTATAAAAAGAKASALSQYIAGITDPEERAYVEAQLGPQIAALNAQRAALEQRAAAQQAAYQSLTAAVIDHLKGVAGSITAPYERIANTQVAAGKAAGESLSAANPNDATQAILQAIGAPEGQRESLETLNRNVFSGGGAVLTGTGGTIPSFQTAGEGVGVLGFAAAQPGIAAAYGQQALQQLLAGQNEQMAGVDSDLQSILANIPKYRSEFAKGEQDAQKEQEDRAMNLYNAGLYTQQQLARDLNLPNWASYPNKQKDSEQDLVRYQDPATGRTLLYNPDTGKSIALPGQGVKPPPKPDVRGSASTGIYRVNQDGTVTMLASPQEKPVRLSFQNIGGRKYGVDPTTGDIKVDLGPAGSSKPKKPVSLQHTTVKGRAVAFNPRTGEFIDPVTRQPIDPNSLSESAKVSSSTMAKARKLIGGIGKTSYYSGDGTEPLTTSQLRATVSQYNSVAKANDQTQITLANVYQMTPDELAVIGLAKKASTPDDAYLGMVQLGVPARRAWQMVKQRYPNWGKGYFSPKADAAQTAAYSSASGLGTALVTFAKEQLGQPYVWGGEARKEGGFDCSGLIDWAYRQQGYTGPRMTTWTIAKTGEHVDKENLQPGDAIITNGGKHVVLYAGNGQVVAGSSAAGKVTMQPLSQHRIVDIRRLGTSGSSDSLAQPVSNSTAKAPSAQMSLAQKYGNQYGVDPRVLLAIAGHETRWGSLGAGRQGYTLGYGVTDGGTLSKYRGIGNQYRYAAQTLARWGVRTLDDILAGKAGAYATDPNWERGVASVYRSLGSSPSPRRSA
jgi:cell wall-associated NlpC family hydrolase